MTISFPENKYLNNRGIIRNIGDTPIDILRPADNLLNIDNVEYCFTYINSSGKAKGGNSIILKLYLAQEVGNTGSEYGDPDLILKILKFPFGRRGRKRKAHKRFDKEVKALVDCQEHSFQNVISVKHSGTCRLKQYSEKKPFLDFGFYTMEYAQYDLKAYIEEKHGELTEEMKLALCISLAEGLQELSSLGYYHRDIKPDNIFIVGDNWKIGDLGLIAERDEEDNLDDNNEFIGPRGWLSPEAMNKFLCYDKGFTFNHDCKIDHQSDIFQLGRVFCYIMQFNNPMGVFRENEMFFSSTGIYQVIRTMLNYSKKRRYKRIEEVVDALRRIQQKLAIS